MNDLLQAMMARRQERLAAVRLPDPEPDPTDDNPPIDTFTENIAYHWRRYEHQTEAPKKKVIKPERAVLAALIRWLKKIPYLDTKRVSVGQMKTPWGRTIRFGGETGESDLVITPHAGQPFERQIHVEAKRPDVIVDGKKVQRAGKQSDGQKEYQAKMEARGDVYVVVTSVMELRSFLEGLGFAGLPSAPKR